MDGININQTLKNGCAYINAMGENEYEMSNAKGLQLYNHLGL